MESAAPAWVKEGCGLSTAVRTRDFMQSTGPFRNQAESERRSQWENHDLRSGSEPVREHKPDVSLRQSGGWFGDCTSWLKRASAKIINTLLQFLAPLQHRNNYARLPQFPISEKNVVVNTSQTKKQNKGKSSQVGRQENSTCDDRMATTTFGFCRRERGAPFTHLTI